MTKPIYTTILIQGRSSERPLAVAEFGGVGGTVGTLIMKFTLLVALLFAFSSFARAEKCGVASLEWLADCSLGIGVYRVETIVNQSVSECVLALSLQETLKHDAPKMFQVEYPLQPPGNLPATTVAVGDRLLVFVGAEHGPINLTTAQPYDAQVAAVTAGGRVLTDTPEILRTVEERLRARPATAPVQKTQNNFVEDYTGRITQPKTFFKSFDTYILIVPEDLRPKQPMFEPESFAADQ